MWQFIKYTLHIVSRFLLSWIIVCRMIDMTAKYLSIANMNCTTKCEHIEVLNIFVLTALAKILNHFANAMRNSWLRKCKKIILCHFGQQTTPDLWHHQSKKILWFSFQSNFNSVTFLISLFQKSIDLFWNTIKLKHHDLILIYHPRFSGNPSSYRKEITRFVTGQVDSPCIKPCLRTKVFFSVNYV